MANVAILGTGLMGAPMAENMLKNGHGVAAWNRTRAKADPLAAKGARVSDTAAEAVAGADIVITMLTNGGLTIAMIEDDAVQGALAPDAIWIDMSSTKPQEARTQSALLQTLGCHHLDAPVSGGTKGAEDGTLAIMAGGPADVFARAEPVLQAMGRPVHVGPSGAGQLAKLANQLIVANTIGAVAEAMLLLDRGGADPAAVRDALKGGFADSTILQQHGARMTNGDFVAGGLTHNQIKDLNNALAEAQAVGLTLPMTEDIRDRFTHFADNMGGADQDHSGLYLELLARNDNSQ